MAKEEEKPCRADNSVVEVKTKDEEQLDRQGCIISISTEIRHSDDREVTRIEIRPKNSWTLEGSRFNTVVKISRKDLIAAVEASNMETEEIKAVKRLMSEVSE